MSHAEIFLPAEHEADAFFDALAGRTEPADGPPALRMALLDELHAVRASERAGPPEPLSARDAATLAQLVGEGVFAGVASASARTGKAARPDGSVVRGVLAWLGQGLQGPSRRYWSTGLAAGFALICVITMLPRESQRGTDAPDILRGAAPLTMSVDAPEAFARSLQAGLEGKGARARAVQINDTQWSLAVTVARPEQSDGVVDYLRGQGFVMTGAPPFILTITKK